MSFQKNIALRAQGKGLQSRPKQAARADTAGAFFPVRLAGWIGISMILIYFTRATIMAWYMHVPESAWVAITSFSLLIGAVLSIFGGGKWRWPWIGVLFAFSLGVWRAEQPSSSAARWLGLACLVFAVGPVIRNPAACQLRAGAWKVFTKGVILLTGIFTVWYLLRLPSPAGRAPFAAFMNQSMLLGPIAAMGTALALAHALNKRSWKWALLVIFGFIPVLASGSRISVLGAGVGISYLLIRRKPLLGLVITISFALAIYSFAISGDKLKKSESVTGALATKGTENTRLDMWQRRIEEFASSPIIGIGIGMGTGEGSALDEHGNIRVEPGSSYLAILAMTGGLGSIAFFSAMGFLIYRFYTHKNDSTLDRDTLSVVGIYMAVNGIAEGWILAFGGPLCFIFWLWLGNFADATDGSASRRVLPSAFARRPGARHMHAKSATAIPASNPL